MKRCGFSTKLIPALLCQIDGGALSVKSAVNGTDDVLFEATLVCAHDSSHFYSIKEGILHFLESQPKVGTEKASEIVARDTQAEAYDSRLNSRYYKEIISTKKLCGRISGKNIIEYGCGTGRMTVELLDADALIACDFSIRSLEILSEKIPDNKNVGLILADATNLRTAKEFFDLSLSTQVMEHIPVKAERNVFLKNISDTLKPGSASVASVYHFDLRRRKHNKPQEGFHNSGIFYHYFFKKELAEEMSAVFKVTDVKNIDITIPGESRLKLSPKLGGLLSRLMEHIPYISEFGHLVLIRAVKEKSAHYSYGFPFRNLPFLCKQWFWFSDPYDVPGAAMVNFFSYADLNAEGFRKSSNMTTVIDLTKPLEEIWGNMRESFIQKQIKKGEKRGLQAKNSTLSEFEPIYKQFRRDRNLPVEYIKPLAECAKFYSVYGEGKVLATGLFVTDGNNIRAWALASLPHSVESDRELVGQANRMLIWHAIQDAKNSGHSLFDLGGISPDSKDDHMRSLASFKEAFGGERRMGYYYVRVYSSLLKLWMRLRGLKI